VTQPRAAFTASANGRPNVLKSPCGIALAGSETSAEVFHDFQAIWDTGATHSAITQAVVDQCDLKPIGKTKVSHAGIDEEPEETDVYLVNIRLPNRVVVENVMVSRGGFSGAEVLIGMDIIKAGDFAITHANGNTKFSFQIPSQADIDFVKAQPLPPPRNRQEWRGRQFGKGK
jgi:hypothetical protein